MNTTSESLLLRLQAANDHQAWSRFVNLYTPLMFFWARKTGLQAQDSADLVQEVLTIVFQKLPDFKNDRERSFRGWLRTVTLNKYREWCRKKSLGFVDTSQSSLANVQGAKGVAESTWDLNYQQALVGRAMDLLEPEFQPKTWHALQQYVVSGCSANAAADSAGISVWTVYAAKSRLMVRLREELEGLLE